MLHDPLTGLPGHALLLDRLEQGLIRARTRGALVSLILITDPDSLLDAARALRTTLRPDCTVARYRENVLAVLTEHDFGDGSPVASLIRQLVGGRAHIHWVTSPGDSSPDDLLATAEER